MNVAGLPLSWALHPLEVSPISFSSAVIEPSGTVIGSKLLPDAASRNTNLDTPKFVLRMVIVSWTALVQPGSVAVPSNNTNNPAATGTGSSSGVGCEKINQLSKITPSGKKGSISVTKSSIMVESSTTPAAHVVKFPLSHASVGICMVWKPKGE